MHDGPNDPETKILHILQWVFFVLGLGAALGFLWEPDIHAHPELVLLGGTGLLGSLSLRVLRGMLRPGHDIEID